MSKICIECLHMKIGYNNLEIGLLISVFFSKLKKWVSFCQIDKKIPQRYHDNLEKIPSFHNFLFIDLLPFEFTNLSLLRMRKACSHGPTLIFQAYTHRPQGSVTLKLGEALGTRPSHTHKNPQIGLAKFDTY